MLAALLSYFFHFTVCINLSDVQFPLDLRNRYNSVILAEEVDALVVLPILIVVVVVVVTVHHFPLGWVNIYVAQSHTLESLSHTSSLFIFLLILPPPIPPSFPLNTRNTFRCGAVEWRKTMKENIHSAGSSATLIKFSCVPPRAQTLLNKLYYWINVCSLNFIYLFICSTSPLGGIN